MPQQPPRPPPLPPPLALTSLLSDREMLVRTHDRMLEVWQEWPEIRAAVARADGNAATCLARVDALAGDLRELRRRQDSMRPKLDSIPADVEETAEKVVDYALTKHALAATREQLAERKANDGWLRKLLTGEGARMVASVVASVIAAVVISLLLKR